MEISNTVKFHKSLLFPAKKVLCTMSETTPAPTSQDPAHNQQNSDKWMWAAVYLGGVALFGFILATFANKGGQGGPGSERSGLAVGEKAPVITAKGWVNGDAPAMEDLKGKVIVVDAWATWCYPCKLEAPKLVKTYKKYQYNPDVRLYWPHFR